LLWSASDGYARNTSPLSLRSLICGALDVGETRRTLFGIVTDCAIGIVALDAISPMITFALFTLMSFVAASTDADACVWPSSEPTIRTDALVSPAFLSAAFWSTTACFTARSRFPPYAAEVTREGQHVADAQLERAVPRRRGSGVGGTGGRRRDRCKDGSRHDRDLDRPRELRHALLLRVTARGHDGRRASSPIRRRPF
jgi:hypothetical protein